MGRRVRVREGVSHLIVCRTDRLYHYLLGEPPDLAPRFALPLSAVPLEHSALTYELGGHRHVSPVTAAKLARTAEIWTENLVREWFGRDRSMMFYHVPQVAVYPEGGIPVRAEWFEAAP